MINHNSEKDFYFYEFISGDNNLLGDLKYLENNHYNVAHAKMHIFPIILAKFNFIFQEDEIQVSLERNGDYIDCDNETLLKHEDTLYLVKGKININFF